MILAGVISLIIGLTLGYLAGLWHQSKDEILADEARTPDMSLIEEARWQVADLSEDMTYLKNLKSLDAHEGVIHNVRMSDVFRQIGDVSKKTQIQADRIVFDAVFVNKENRITTVVLRKSRNARIMQTILRKAGVKVLLRTT